MAANIQTIDSAALRKTERWRYTNASILATPLAAQAATTIDVAAIVDKHRLTCPHILLVIVDGIYQAGFSTVDHSADMAIKNLSASNALRSAAKEFPAVNLNVEQPIYGLHLQIKNNVEQPIHLLNLQTNSGMTNSQHRIDVLNNCQIHIFEETINLNADAIANQVMQIELGENSQINYFKIASTKQIATYFVNQAAHSRSQFTNLSVNSLFIRDEIVVQLNAPFANCQTRGFYRLHQNNQYVDNHIDIAHLAADTSSEMFYKGIVDQNAKAVFNGRLLVAKDAQRIAAEQTNHNLLLSSKAEVYTKPELEIYADDVRCKHGASVGQLDEDALFYLQARGVDKETATMILLNGFAEEVLATIQLPVIRARFAEVLNAVA